MKENSIIKSGLEMDKKLITLEKIKIDNINWSVYYLDGITQEKWIKEFPFSEMQAGGPPQLRLIEKFPWE